jgi:hypothetical protein
MIGKLYIEFLDQPLIGDTFTYSINENYTPILYDNGDNIVHKTYGSASNNVYVNRIARLNDDFTLDTGFNPGTNSYTLGFDSSVYDIGVLPSGEMIVGGDFNQYNGSVRKKIIKLSATGSVIGSWGAGSQGPIGLNANVRTIAITSTSSIYLGGDFTAQGSYQINRILKLKPTGFIDTTFNQGSTGFNATVTKIVEQPDGKIIVGGAFTLYKGVKVNRICRLNANGTLDTSFNNNIGAGFTDAPTDIFVESDGRILVTHRSTSFNNSFSPNLRYITRINANGQIGYWNNLSSGFPIGSSVRCIKWNPANSSFYIGGSFTSYNNTVRTSIVKVDIYGQLDSNFNPVFGGSVNDIEIDSDGNVVAVGQFPTLNGDAFRRIATVDPATGADLSNGNNGLSATVNVIKQVLSSTDWYVGGDFAQATSLLSSPYDIQIGNTLVETQENTLNNLLIYNTNPNISYQSIGNLIEVTFLAPVENVITYSDVQDIPDRVLIYYRTENISLVTMDTRPQTLTPVYMPIIFKFTSSGFSKKNFSYIIDMELTSNNITYNVRERVRPLIDGSGEIDISKILSAYTTVDFDPFSNFNLDCVNSYVNYNISLGEESLGQWNYDAYKKYNTGTIYPNNIMLFQLPGNLAPHTYSVGDQINVISGVTSSIITGLQTVVAVPSLSSVVISQVSPTLNVEVIEPGETFYADNRNVIYSNEYNLDGLCAFNGSFPWNANNQDGNFRFKDYLATTYMVNDSSGLTASAKPDTRFLTNMPTYDFYVTPEQDVWLNYATYLSIGDSTELIWSTNTGLTGSIIIGTSSTNEKILVRQVNVSPMAIGATVSGFFNNLKSYSFHLDNDGQVTRDYTINIDNRCKIEDYEIVFMDRLGSLVSYSFPLRAYQKGTIDMSMYKQRFDVQMSETKYDYNTYDRGSTVTNVKLEEKYDLNTNFMNDAMSVYFLQLKTSPYTWIKLDGEYYPCILEVTDYDTIRQQNEQLIRYSITVTLGNDNIINI